mmetsp:Transcript_35682/g.114720  ORF Transcript_35682/g.114720 Transcript_35682/m.114720 type:complete len:315 (-) Transcript_35682:1118-2062(-)
MRTSSTRASPTPSSRPGCPSGSASRTRSSTRPRRSRCCVVFLRAISGHLGQSRVISGNLAGAARSSFGLRQAPCRRLGRRLSAALRAAPRAARRERELPPASSAAAASVPARRRAGRGGGRGQGAEEARLPPLPLHQPAEPGGACVPGRGRARRRAAPPGPLRRLHCAGRGAGRGRFALQLRGARRAATRALPLRGAGRGAAGGARGVCGESRRACAGAAQGLLRPIRGSRPPPMLRAPAGGGSRGRRLAWRLARRRRPARRRPSHRGGRRSCRPSHAVRGRRSGGRDRRPDGASAERCRAFIRSRARGAAAAP